MTGLETFGLILGTSVVGSLAHEATHYLVAKLGGRNPEFSLREWAVFWRSPRDPEPVDWAIAVAPLVVGLIGGVALLSLGMAAWWLVPAWYLYTLHGAVTNDLKLSIVEEEAA